MTTQKCIHSLRIARALMRKGFTLIDIEPAKKYKTGLVFIFQESAALNTEFKKILGGIPSDDKSTNQRQYEGK